MGNRMNGYFILSCTSWVVSQTVYHLQVIHSPESMEKEPIKTHTQEKGVKHTSRGVNNTEKGDKNR